MPSPDGVKRVASYRTGDKTLFKRIGDSDDLLTRLQGASVLLLMWSIWLGGTFSPFWLTYLLVKGYYKAFVIWGLVLAYSFVVDVKQSPAFVRFVLSGSGWWQGGACLYIEESIAKELDVSERVLLCQHPHGLYCYGYFLNGSAARVHARVPEVYVPERYKYLTPNQTGLVEPNLFRVPLIRHFLKSFGCAAPATKERMLQLLEAKAPMGILPGGSEEIIISKHGHERVYILRRKGFIKYALQHGYQLMIGYTFGESDSYYTLPWGLKWRLNFLRKTRFPLFAAWGVWWCPLLPRSNVALETVLGNPIKLPKIPNPTSADIDKYHALYVEKLVDLFDRNKHAFGYPDRKLELF